MTAPTNLHVYRTQCETDPSIHLEELVIWTDDQGDADVFHLGTFRWKPGEVAGGGTKEDPQEGAAWAQVARFAVDQIANDDEVKAAWWLSGDLAGRRWPIRGWRGRIARFLVRLTALVVAWAARNASTDGGC